MTALKRIFLVLVLLTSSLTNADRIKDLTDVAGVRPNQVLGFGLVTGLQGTGDGKDLPMTAQALKTLLSGMGVSVDGPITDFDLGDQQSYLIKWLLNHDPSLRPTSLGTVLISREQKIYH